MHPFISYITRRLEPQFGFSEARAMAWWVTEEVTGKTQTELISISDCKDTEKNPNIEIILQRLLKNEPIQYIFGHSLWYGMDLKVNSSTLIPRPETAELVDWVLEEHQEATLRVVDIGTGSGCIALALKKMRPHWQVTGIDISKNALEVAKDNGERQGIEVQWIEWDILSKSPISSEQLLVSNPPYVRMSDLYDKSVKEYEPEGALWVSEDDPLLYYRAIARQGVKSVYVEINEKLSEETKQVFEEAGYTNIRIKKDSYGKYRFIAASLA